MGKSKSIISGDRLSKLPDSLIFDIFWLLPARDVVRTTILSKRWRDLWRTSPFLNFTGCKKDRLSKYKEDGVLDRFRDFTNRVLLLWRGEKILKFKIEFKFDRTRSLVRDIGVWVRFTIEKQVEELYLDLLYCPEEYDLDMDFEWLYSCPSLKVLWLRGCHLDIVRSGNVKWDRLKCLTIYDDFSYHDDFTKVLGGSPKLEVVFWKFYDNDSNLCIRSNTLKELSIDKYREEYDYVTDVPRNTELEIRAPNLKRLEILGIPYEKFLLNVSSLTDLTLGFCGWCLYTIDVDGFLKESLKQILPTLQRVERVMLSDWCLEVLGDMNKKSLLSPLCNVKFLKLNVWFSKPIQILDLLGIFSELKRLVIENEKTDDYEDVPESLEFEANLPNSFLMQLRTVDVTLSKGGYAIFSFMEIILKYASKLEKMVIRVKPTFDLTERYSASQKLLRMARSSPTAQLIFCGLRVLR